MTTFKIDKYSQNNTNEINNKDTIDHKDTDNSQDNINDDAEKEIVIEGPASFIVAKALQEVLKKPTINYDEENYRCTIKSPDIKRDKITIYATTPKYINFNPLLQYNQVKNKDIIFIDTNNYKFHTDKDEWFLTTFENNVCYTLTDLRGKIK